MKQTLETRFRQYRECGDSESLAAVFDGAAPGLLEIAVHLSRDMASAEDLVQETFLVAIESRSQWDESRPLRPWLHGILANRARLRNRHDGRYLDPKRIETKAEQSSILEGVENREDREKLALAVDRLPDPYRQLLLLEIEHGMTPSEIGHLLRKSAGTIRVQLHRGRQILRQNLAPTVQSSRSVSVLFAAPYGLDAIRDTVLAKAHVVATTSMSSTVGGMILVKKLAAVVLGVIAISTLVVTLSLSENSLNSDPAIQVSDPTASPLSSMIEPHVESVEASRVVVKAKLSKDEGWLLGRVVSASDEAIEGAEVALYDLRRLPLKEIKSRWFNILDQEERGRFRVKGGWQSLAAPIPDGFWNPNQMLDFYGEPDLGEEPVASAQSNEDGNFELDSPIEQGVLAVSHPLYATRYISVPTLDFEPLVTLYELVPFKGYVVDVYGEPLNEVIEFIVENIVSQSDATASLQSTVTSTDRKGTFKGLIGALNIQMRCLTPGYNFVHRGIHPESKEPYVFPMSFSIPSEESIILVAHKVLYLEVKDAGDHSPIQDFTYFASGLINGYLYRGCRTIHSPSGRVNHFEDSPFKTGQDEGIRFTVWADGYAPSIVDVPRPNEAHCIEVFLEPGGLSSVSGRVLSMGKALKNVEVLLGPSERHTGEAGGVLCETNTGVDGAFRLSAPDGDYALTARSKNFEYSKSVKLPDETFLEINLDLLSHLTVSVHDPSDRPKAGRHVIVRAGVKSLRKETNAEGNAIFKNLDARDYEVFTFSQGSGAIDPDSIRRLTLTPGEIGTLKIVEAADPKGPVFPRAVLTGVTDFTGWKVSSLSYNDWKKVEGDGTLPFDCADRQVYLQVESPDGLRRSISAKQGQKIIALEGGSLSCVGMIVDETTREPIPNLRVTASFEQASSTEDRPRTSRMSMLTSANGAFRFDSLPDREIALSFGEERSGDDWVGKGITYFPKPGYRGPLKIRIPKIVSGRYEGLEYVEMKGRVLDKDSGEPLGGASVSVSSSLERPFGKMTLYSDPWMVTALNDGTFVLNVPRSDQNRVLVRAFGETQGVFIDWKEGDSTTLEISGGD